MDSDFKERSKQLFIWGIIVTLIIIVIALLNTK